MKFGVCIPNFGNNANKLTIDKVAESAERFEYDSIWTTDHIIVPKKERTYVNTYESISTLAYLSAKTENILLGTSIIVLPLRDPIILAKEIATIDNLSEVRVILGIGVGWLREEFVFLKKDFQNRGKIADEYIKTMKEIWVKEEIEYKIDEETVNFVSLPKPIKIPKILIGGNSKRAIKRAAKIGDGWFPVGMHYDDIRKGREILNKLSPYSKPIFLRILVNVGGRKIMYKGTTGELRVSLGGSDREIINDLEKYKKSGVIHVACWFGEVNVEEFIERMRKFKEIMNVFG
ncbi:MAG: TIGR03619 family F420-dependent LLM class oxidoreductase [Thermoproteota archaeon]|jgi:probable F420-dependent oxidoreductase|nr:TIGR03619 family F420-dependent LLM class oxidoreductase [Thermoproteota archaeon]